MATVSASLAPATRRARAHHGEAMADPVKEPPDAAGAGKPDFAITVSGTLFSVWPAVIVPKWR